MQPFPDYGFKLVVLDQLLKSGSFSSRLSELKSKPSISARLSGTEHYGESIEEIDAFFRSVELTSEDLSKVITLCFDGGNAIYQLITPFWDGESDEFDVLSVDGYESLPNLKSVFYCSMISKDQLNRLQSSGIHVE